MDKHKAEYIIEQVNKLKSKTYEILLITPLLVDTYLLNVRPFTQHFIQSDSGHFYIDLYYPELKLAIEIDEPHHENQLLEDEERERIITEKENCHFKRIKIDKDFDIIKSLKELKDLIIEKRTKLINSDTFTEWTIKTFEIPQAQTDYPNAIFFNATKSFDNNFDPTRGPLRIKEETRKNADTFVTISAGTVTNVYSISPDNWVEFEQKNLGFKQTGQELSNHPLLSSGTTEWNFTSNKILGAKLNE